MMQPENYSKLVRNSRLALAMTLCLGTAGLQAAQSTYTTPVVSSNNNFTMLDVVGGLIGGATDVEMTWDGTVFDDSADYTGPGSSTSNMSLSSVTPFFGQLWTAHDVQVFIGPGTYSFDVTLGGGAAETGTLVMDLADGQLGAHMLFDWGVTLNIDVGVVWDRNIPFPGDQTLSGSGPWNLASIDGDNDGIAGIKMPDGGPFAGSQANFNLNGINFPPVAGDVSTSTLIDIPTTIDLAANATDPDGTIDATSVAIPTGPANGALINNGDGTVTYTPNLGFISPPVDSFQYTVDDNDGATSNVGTVQVTVTATANTPPVANDVQFSTNEDVALDINITDTDDVGTDVATDTDGDSLTFASFTQGSNGAVTVDATNTVLTYTPTADFSGTDTFDFVVNDGVDDSNTGTITLTVNPVNDAPVCTDVTLNTGVDTPLAIDVANDLLSTCTDAEDDAISLDSTTQPTEPGSTLSFDGVNTLSYTPASGFSGQDTFTYTVIDENAATDTRTVFVDVGKIFGNFTMLDGDGVTFGGTNDVVFSWDGTCYNSVAEADAGPVNMLMESDSSFPFFGFPWFAHDIKVYCPGGPYTIDSCNAGVTPPDCGPLSFTVPAGHLGGHILFDWNVTVDIDVAIVWNNSTGGVWENVVPTGQLYQGPAGPTPALDEFFEWISVDADGDGIPGIQFVDGPFVNFRANFNFKTTASDGGNVEIPVSTVPSPNLGSACSIGRTPSNLLNGGDWLVVSGFIAWLGIGACRRRQSKLH